jgi:hypothetical protein
MKSIPIRAHAWWKTFSVALPMAFTVDAFLENMSAALRC